MVSVVVVVSGVKNRRVSNAALANAALVLSSKNWKKYSRWARRRKINPKSLGSVFSLCCRAGMDAALVKADFFFTGVPTIENKIEQKIQNTKVASATIVHKTDTCRKNCLGELISAYITEGAPKKMVWGINLGIGP